MSHDRPCERNTEQVKVASYTKLSGFCGMGCLLSNVAHPTKTIKPGVELDMVAVRRRCQIGAGFIKKKWGWLCVVYDVVQAGNLNMAFRRKEYTI